MDPQRDPEHSRPGSWFLDVAVQLAVHEPRLLLAPLGVASILTVLPVIEVVRFLRADGPWWAFVASAIWVGLAGRLVWHIDRRRVDRLDVAFFVAHLIGSIALTVAAVNEAWHAA